MFTFFIARCSIILLITLSFIMLSVIMLNFIMLSAIMLNVIMLSGVITANEVKKVLVLGSSSGSFSGFYYIVKKPKPKQA